MPSRTILVAEDDDGVRDLIQIALRRGGHTVLAAADGRAAMDVLDDGNQVVDVLVSDVNMPGVGGIELLEFARSRRPGLALVLASGTNRLNMPPDRIEGDVTLLEKPFTIRDLTRAVEAALERVSSDAPKTDMDAEGDDGQVYGG